MSTEVKEFAIVKRIMKLLKLDDAGKINKFFAKEVKNAETGIRDIKNYISALKNQYEANVAKINDKIEDAKENVAAAYEAVTPTDVINNEAMERFSSTFWMRVESAENKLDELQQTLVALEEKYNKEVKAEEAKISKLQSRIEKITK